MYKLSDSVFDISLKRMAIMAICSWYAFASVVEIFQQNSQPLNAMNGVFYLIGLSAAAINDYGLLITFGSFTTILSLQTLWCALHCWQLSLVLAANVMLTGLTLLAVIEARKPGQTANSAAVPDDDLKSEIKPDLIV